MIFDKALNFVLEWEGGYVDHPSDRGGATNKGITQAVYDEWNRMIGNPAIDVKAITDREVKEIYHTLYWDAAHCYRMDSPLAVVMFDTAVNFGVAGAISFLQEALGILPDGEWGAQTEAAFSCCSQRQVAEAICDLRYKYRLERVYEDRSQSIFLEGWHRRDRALKQLISDMKYVTITAVNPTFLKRKPIPSSSLKDGEKISIAAGTKIRASIVRRGLHHEIQLESPLKGFFNWFIFPPHWAEEGNRQIDWSNFDAKISKHFSVGEVTQNDKRRIPTDPVVISNILTLAGELDKVRDAWGAPIGVTSWYRPPAINAAVGGVPNSQHINGSAADIYPTSGDIFKFEKWLDAFWGDRALGYGANRGFVHVDLRPGRIRWDY